MAHLNLGVGWAGILVGLLLGAGIGLFFHKADWLGGYGGSGSVTRRAPTEGSP